MPLSSRYRWSLHSNSGSAEHHRQRKTPQQVFRTSVAWPSQKPARWTYTNFSGAARPASRHPAARPLKKFVDVRRPNAGDDNLLRSACRRPHCGLPYRRLANNEFTRHRGSAPRCSPSRASLLTGRYPHSVGVRILTNDDRPHGYRSALNTAAPNLAERLKERGYTTALVGKWHLSPDAAATSSHASCAGRSRSLPRAMPALATISLMTSRTMPSTSCGARPAPDCCSSCTSRTPCRTLRAAGRARSAPDRDAAAA